MTFSPFCLIDIYLVAFYWPAWLHKSRSLYFTGISVASEAHIRAARWLIKDIGTPRYGCRLSDTVRHICVSAEHSCRRTRHQLNSCGHCAWISDVLLPWFSRLLVRLLYAVGDRNVCLESVSKNNFSKWNVQLAVMTSFISLPVRETQKFHVFWLCSLECHFCMETIHIKDIAQHRRTKGQIVWYRMGCHKKYSCQCHSICAPVSLLPHNVQTNNLTETYYQLSRQHNALTGQGCHFNSTFRGRPLTSLPLISSLSLFSFSLPPLSSYPISAAKGLSWNRTLAWETVSPADA